MKKRFILVFCIFSIFSNFVFGQTRHIVPRNAGEGGIGTMDKPWGPSFFTNSLTLNGKTINDWEDRTITMKTINAGLMEKGDSTNIPGVVVAVYDDAPINEVNSYSLWKTNEEFIVDAMEDWKGNATTLTIANDGDNFGTLDGEFDSKVVANGAWMYLDNVIYPLWITNVNSTTVEWIGGYWTNNLAGNYNIEKIGPVKQDNYLGFMYGSRNGNNLNFLTINSSSRQWTGLATADGITIYASVNNGKIWKSVNGGQSWTELKSDSRAWFGLATADGVTVYAAVKGGYIYKSVDGGQTWNQTGSASAGWFGLATADGVTVYAAVRGGYIYKSVDGGQTWNQTGSGTRDWQCIATADGVTVYAGLWHEYIYKSVDGGQTWNQTGSASADWYGLATADGVTVYAAATTGGYIYKSADGGQTWNQLGWSASWYDIDISSDGITIYALINNSYIYKAFIKAYSESTNQPYTTIFNFSPNQTAYKVNDFATAENGNTTYWSMETKENLEWSIFGLPSLDWHVIAKRETTNDYWQIRIEPNPTSTNYPPLPDSYTTTTTTKAEEAISMALETNSYNRMPAVGYSSSYEWPAFYPQQPIRFACTFYNQNSANSPVVNGVYLDSEIYGGEYALDNDGYRVTKVEFSETNLISNVERIDDAQASAEIFYIDQFDTGN